VCRESHYFPTPEPAWTLLSRPPMPALVSLCRRDDGHWYVTADGQYLVGFSGPAAHELAARQRTELAELLNVDQPDSSENDGKAELFQTDR
jgi:hypothetical protein